MSNTVFCIGELLIDFFCTEVDVDLIDGQQFLKQAGGAPANVCVTVAKLGGESMFCGKVGNDSFGQYLKRTLERKNVNTSMLVLDDECHTTLAFVSRQAGGERDFIFNRGADARLEVKDIDAKLLSTVKIGHFGSATALLSDPFKTTYIQCMHTLKAQGKFISFDPNFRGDLWKLQTEQFVQWCHTCMVLADFVKVSEDELYLITAMDNCEEAVSSLHEKGVRVIAVTLGARGTYISVAGEGKFIPSIEVQSIDSTGAGDAFVGATLQRLTLCNNMKALTLADYEPIIQFANVVAALSCEKIGSMKAIPAVEEVEQYIK